MQEAWLAFVDMRRRTGQFIASAGPGSVSARARLRGLLSGAGAGARLLWLWLRILVRPDEAMTRPTVVVYAPGRTPRRSGETTIAFLERIGRSNRPGALPELLELGRGETILCLRAMSGLAAGKSEASPDPSVLEFILGLLTPRHLPRFARDMLAARRGGLGLGGSVSVALLERLSREFARHPRRIVLLTSNATLVEMLRLAALPHPDCSSIEILHGIASLGMEPYYDFLAERAEGECGYVNLIAGLAQFPSIEATMRRDGEGEIAVNAQIWSRMGPGKALPLDADIVARAPFVFAGGTSGDPDYFASSFFESERTLIGLLRRLAPERAVYYCPHPANAGAERAFARLREELGEGVVLAPVSTLEMLFMARAVFGTYSTSVFEAGLLGKPVFLLPFDDSMLLPALLTDVHKPPGMDALEDALRVFLAGLPPSSPDTLFDQTAHEARARLGLDLVRDAQGA